MQMHAAWVVQLVQSQVPDPFISSPTLVPERVGAGASVFQEYLCSASLQICAFFRKIK